MTDANTAQLVLDLQSTDSAVRGMGWVAPGLGAPNAPLSLLGSTVDPLSGLAAAGLGWFTPLVSFLGEGLTQLRGGNADSVTSGAADFGDAGQAIAGVADSYRASASAQTSEWSGDAASGYRYASARHADGVAGLGQASSTVSGAIIGAGQVVAQAIAEVTELITEAVAQIVPVMTQAVARSGETLGQSVVEAIPQCVGVAAEYALRVAAKLAAVLASGSNLLELVRGGMSTVDVIDQALSGISRQSIGAEVPAVPGVGVDQQGDGPVDTAGVVEPGATGSPGPPSSGATPPTSGGSVSPQGTHSWTPQASHSFGTVEATQGAVPDALRSSGFSGGSGVSTSTTRGGGVSIGAADADAGADTAGQEGSQRPARAAGGGAGPLGGVPLGASGGAQAATGTDDGNSVPQASDQ